MQEWKFFLRTWPHTVQLLMERRARLGCWRWGKICARTWRMWATPWYRGRRVPTEAKANGYSTYHPRPSPCSRCISAAEYIVLAVICSIEVGNKIWRETKPINRVLDRKNIITRRRQLSSRTQRCQNWRCISMVTRHRKALKPSSARILTSVLRILPSRSNHFLPCKILSRVEKARQKTKEAA